MRIFLEKNHLSFPKTVHTGNEAPYAAVAKMERWDLLALFSDLSLIGMWAAALQTVTKAITIYITRRCITGKQEYKGLECLNRMVQ